MNTQEILDRLKAVCEAATDGPWGAEAGGLVTTMTPEQIAIFDPTGDVFARPDEESNARFAALSRTALPAQRSGLAQLYALAIEAQNMGVEIEPADVIGIIDDALAPLKERKDR